MKLIFFMHRHRPVFRPRSICVRLLSLCALTITLELAQADDYAIIANLRNPLETNSSLALKNEVRLLFLREKFRWGHGALATPLSPPFASGSFQHFREEVLQMRRKQWADHWVRQKQLYGHSAPREVNSESLLIKLVERDPGALGIVSLKAAAAAGDKVKTLFSY